MAAFTASVDGAPARETESVVARTVPVAPVTVSATGCAVLDTGADSEPAAAETVSAVLDTGAGAGSCGAPATAPATG
jgi:hypothetical protein